jgi:hypothetical protein
MKRHCGSITFSLKPVSVAATNSGTIPHRLQKQVRLPPNARLLLALSKSAADRLDIADLPPSEVAIIEGAP